MLTQHQKRAPQSSITCQAVDPSHRISTGCVGRKSLEQCSQIGYFDGSLLDVASHNRFELHRRRQNNACQPHATAGGVKQLGVFGWRGVDTLAVTQQQRQAQHINAKGACAMVILSMYVTGNGPAHRDKASARRYRQKPATRYKGLQNRI